MKFKEIKLFSDLRQNSTALKLAKCSLELPFFIEDNKFNPSLDTPDAFLKVRMVRKVEGEYESHPVTAAVKSNYRNGLTSMPEGFLAGLFSEILKVYGYDEFSKRWKDYLNDYIMHAVPCDPYKVYDLIKGSTINFKLGEMPDHDRIISMKLINRWNNDLKSAASWSLRPSEYSLSRDQRVYETFRDASKLSGQRMSRLLKLDKCWAAGDAWDVMLWCIASGVHPLRLLNFAGYWMTHKEGQPEEFSLQNPVTQAHEVELKKEGKTLGYELAKPQFSAGFIFNFASLMREITWFTSEGKFKKIISEEFLGFCNCFIMEDFYICGGLVWQEVPLTRTGAAYYEGAGISIINPKTIKEVSKLRASRIAKNNEAKGKRNKASNTGNPMFDMEMIKDNED